MQIINEKPQMISRGLAQKIGISNGSAYYLLLSLINMGFIKHSNFKENSQKTSYVKLLMPNGVSEKSLLTHKFFAQKK